MIYENNNEGQFPQADAVEHIFQILNDVKGEDLPVSDAVDSLAYWYHEAFAQGDISVEPGEGKSASEDTEFGDLSGGEYWT